KQAREEAPQTLEKVPTPSVSSIEALAAFLQIPADRIAKTVADMATIPGDLLLLVMVVVPGHLEVSEIKVQNMLGAVSLRAAMAEELQGVGAVPGYMSPVGLATKEVMILADELVQADCNWVVGANEVDHHLLNARYGRDFEAHRVGDLVAAFAGAPAPNGSGSLQAVRGIEVGNIFQLGTKYSMAMGATFMEVNGKPEPIIMGSYGIGVGRLLACLAEEHHDEHGLQWPISVTPYQVNLVLLPDNQEVIDLAEQVYADLSSAGVEVLFDDRDKKTAGPGVKFKDADLRGMPLRLTVSGRSLKSGGVEFKPRKGGESEIISPEEVLAHTQTLLGALWEEMDEQLTQASIWASKTD
ncbi:MAG: YbaK/EbsC family protein, partial [Bacteroidota bacterium]